MTDFVENFKNLNDKQQEAIALLLAGETNKMVASKIAVDENTVYRWRNSEPFKSTLNELRLKSIEEVEIKLLNLGSKALQKLSYLLEYAENENNQLKASLFILDRILQYSQLEFMQRIDAIEERLFNNE